MNHTEAIETNAAESYMLGELVDPARDAFEEHYFDCRVCAETVRAGAAMFASGGEVVRNEKSFRRFRPMTRIRAAAASAAATAAAIVIGYQTLIIPGLRSGPMAARTAPIEVVTQQHLIDTDVARSEADDSVIRQQKGKKALVPIGISDPQYVRYRLELRDPSRRLVEPVAEVSAGEVSADEGVVPLLLGPLPAGRYVLAIVGVRKDGNRSEIARRSVVVE